LWKQTPSRLVIGSVGRFPAQTTRLSAQVCSLDHPVDEEHSMLTCGVPYDAGSREPSPGRSYWTIMQRHSC